GTMIYDYAKYKRTNGAINRREKIIAKDKFEVSKTAAKSDMDAITLKLMESVLDSEKRLKAEIGRLNTELSELLERADKDDAKIKKLKLRIQELENLEVKTNIEK